MKKSIDLPSSQSGATLAEILVGITIISLLIALVVVVIGNTRESTRMDSTLAALYTLKEEVKRVNRSQGSYTQGRMLPLLFAAKAFPDTLDVDYDKRSVTTPLGHPIDVVGRGAHFSLDIYGLTPNECYDLSAQIMSGNYFALGSKSDDFEVFKVGEETFDDSRLPDAQILQEACTDRLSIDLIMAFR